MHGFHQSQVANCDSATGCTKPSQTYSLAPLSYSTSSPSSSASSRLLLSCTSEYPKLERVIITTCKNLATERGLCTQCTPSNSDPQDMTTHGLQDNGNSDPQDMTTHGLQDNGNSDPQDMTTHGLQDSGQPHVLLHGLSELL